MADDNTLPRATVTPAVLADEPATDRAFLCAEDGRTYRVRLVEVAQPGGDIVVAPFLRAFDLTVVRLDADGAPERNAADQVVIVGATRWSIDAEAVSALAGLTVERQLDLLVGNLIHKARLTADAPRVIDAMLADWGAAGTAQASSGSAPTA